MHEKRIVIAGAVRTPAGKFGSRLKSVASQDLLSTCFKETVHRTAIDFDMIDAAIAGTCTHLPDAMNVARVALLLAGLPDEVVLEYRNRRVLPRDAVRQSLTATKEAFTVSRNCGSGVQAIISAAQALLSDDARVLLVGGTESMSHAPFMLPRAAGGYRMQDLTMVDSLLHGLTDPLTGELMGLTAEHVAEKYQISREDQDAFAAQSHQRAFRAVRSGKFKSQIAPVLVLERGVLGAIREEIISEDEGPDPTLTPAKLASLKPYFKKEGTVTPTNSCSTNDGAASFLVMTLERAEELGIEPEAEIIEYGAAALDPSFMGEGPSCVVPSMLARVGLAVPDVDVFEINEAFAATTLAVQRSLGIPDDKLNIYGGAIALGHPVGATGVILTVKAINLLKDLGKEHAVVSLCVGNGQGVGLTVRNIA